MLDIVIPVYNEGPNIRSVLESFREEVKVPYRVLICYDFEEDTTLPALAALSPEQFHFQLVKNPGRGALDAILAGLRQTTAPFVLTFPADDDYNASRINAMVEKARAGNDIVCASRFIAGGYMRDCPWLKALLVRAAAFFVHRVARIPSHDATNGLRMFSRRVIDRIPIESKVGFAYSIELLVKCHRLGWPVAEVPFLWQERKAGKSRFLTLRWIPVYMQWVGYALETTWVRKTHVELVAERSSVL